MNSSLADITVLAERVRVLEAESAVRRVLHRYMALCDVPGEEDRLPALRQLFCSDAYWQGVGSRYARKFGRLEGREAIVAMLAGYLPPNPHFRFNAHFLAGEQIAVDGLEVTGRWLLQQLSRYDSGQGEAIVAALNLRFRLEEGAWRIASFTTERLDVCPFAHAQEGQS
ncbi:nuclear transport factor 2 family protein [Pseudomonas sp. TH05]|uniref:nuclear transport factor 2 family protein n=1 Tax=unclassified Pseudomonas TaxID=196821 RepID=UPI001912385E|nr:MULTISPECIES: nuclear transport factor 2 family protein [unclassified Pseudomonas]MBK5540242.1 nuclear transport factor 2 family protein [Pseudomonas sp. TH07]MBK5560290.1 nuclear transport factor 2 family protein [Pseudomonas sp. TH05]